MQVFEYKSKEQKTLETKKQVKIGNIIRKENAYMDLWMVIDAHDHDDHWRGKDNLVYTIVCVHDTYHGWYDLPMFRVEPSRFGMEKMYPKQCGEHFAIMQDIDTVNTYDVANNDVIAYEVYADSLKEAHRKLEEEEQTQEVFKQLPHLAYYY